MYNFDQIVKDFKIFSLTFVSRTMFPSAQRRKIGHLVDNGKTITLYGVEKNQPKITLLLWKTVVKKRQPYGVVQVLL